MVVTARLMPFQPHRPYKIRFMWMAHVTTGVVFVATARVFEFPAAPAAGKELRQITGWYSAAKTTGGL